MHTHTYTKESKLHNTCKSTCQIACFLQSNASKVVAGNESKWRTKMSPTCSLNCSNTHILVECKQMSQKLLWNHDRTEMSLPRKGEKRMTKRLTIQLILWGLTERACWTTSQFFTGFLPFSLTSKRTLRMSSSLPGLLGRNGLQLWFLLYLGSTQRHVLTPPPTPHPPHNHNGLRCHWHKFQTVAWVSSTPCSFWVSRL